MVPPEHTDFSLNQGPVRGYLTKEKLILPRHTEFDNSFTPLTVAQWKYLKDSSHQRSLYPHLGTAQPEVPVIVHHSLPQYLPGVCQLLSRWRSQSKLKHHIFIPIAACGVISKSTKALRPKTSSGHDGLSTKWLKSLSRLLHTVTPVH